MRGALSYRLVGQAKFWNVEGITQLVPRIHDLLVFPEQLEISSLGDAGENCALVVTHSAFLRKLALLEILANSLRRA